MKELTKIRLNQEREAMAKNKVANHTIQSSEYFNDRGMAVLTDNRGSSLSSLQMGGNNRGIGANYERGGTTASLNNRGIAMTTGPAAASTTNGVITGYTSEDSSSGYADLLSNQRLLGASKIHQTTNGAHVGSQMKVTSTPYESNYALGQPTQHYYYGNCHI